MVRIYLEPRRGGAGYDLIDVDSGKVLLVAIGWPQAWLAARAQGWKVEGWEVE